VSPQEVYESAQFSKAGAKIFDLRGGAKWLIAGSGTQLA
jgi:hypothetical protein